MTKKIILITGCSTGIGFDSAFALKKRGHRVIASCRKVDDVTKLSNMGIETVLLDVSDSDSINTAFTQVMAWTEGRLDVLINNAALAQEKPYLEITESDYEKVMKVNLQVPFILSQKLIPHMREQKWGRIINISSIGGQWGGVNQIHYAVSKAGLINLTRSIAKTFGKDELTCNCIAPGLIKTDMIELELKSEAGRKKVEMIPSGRLGEIEEVAATVRFLISDQASYINGQTINLNGGLYFN